jgi:hypothetical protein
MAAPTNGAAELAAPPSTRTAHDGGDPHEPRALTFPPEQIAAARAEGREDGLKAGRAEGVRRRADPHRRHPAGTSTPRAAPRSRRASRSRPT